MINAYITNLGKYNEGTLQCEYLKLPATTEAVQALLSRIKVDGVMYEEIFITDYDTNISGLSRCLDQYASINELNYLASLIEDMDEWDVEKFETAIACGDHSGSVQDLINLTQNLDCYEYYPSVNDYDDLGRYLIDELGFEEIPERLEAYFDYSSYAEAHVCNEGGEFIKDGFVSRNSVDFDEHYKGRNDMPSEYKIFAYPPPKKSISKALVNYTQMISEAPTTPTTEKSLTIPSKTER